jgi:hypothetical protein
MLAFATALTTPWATMVFPAVCFISYSRGKNILPSSFSPSNEESLLVSKEEESEDIYIEADSTIQRYEIYAAYFALFVGIASGVLCFVAAIGQVAIPQLRGSTGVESFC